MGRAARTFAMPAVEAGQREALGVTSEISGLGTYLLGALVYQGYYWIAATIAVISLLLLELKPSVGMITVMWRTLARTLPFGEERNWQERKPDGSFLSISLGSVSYSSEVKGSDPSGHRYLYSFRVRVCSDVHYCTDVIRKGASLPLADGVWRSDQAARRKGAAGTRGDSRLVQPHRGQALRSAS